MTIFERAVLTSISRLIKLDGGELVPSDAMILYQDVFDSSATADDVLTHIEEMDL